jgi:hypothetical protein
MDLAIARLALPPNEYGALNSGRQACHGSSWLVMASATGVPSAHTPTGAHEERVMAVPSRHDVLKR